MVHAPQVQAELAQALGIQLQDSTARKLLRGLGLSHPVGRPAPATRPQPRPLAGAELLKAVDLELGAAMALTRDLEAAMAGLLPIERPEGVESAAANFYPFKHRCGVSRALHA